MSGGVECERNTSADLKVTEEGGGGVSKRLCGDWLPAGLEPQQADLIQRGAEILNVFLMPKGTPFPSGKSHLNV